MLKLIILIMFGLIFPKDATDSFSINKESKIEVYSALFWAPCKEAKKLLQSRGIDFETKMITFSRKNNQELIDRTGGKGSLPQIFIDEKYFGGLTELKKYFND